MQHSIDNKIYTERLYMRELRDEDLDQYYEIMKQDEVGKWLGSSRGKTYDETKNIIHKFSKQWKDKGYGVWGVIDKKSGKLLGHCGLNFLEETSETEILYAFDPNAWGNGYATEAAKAALNYAFNEAKLQRLIALAKPDNLRSINVIEKLASKYIGDKEYFGLQLKYFEIGKKVNYVEQIKSFTPKNGQENQDKKVMLDYIEKFPHNILLRDNEFAHITSSGFIMNEALDKVLMIHHNIRNVWAWTGGHADGDTDFLHVAIKEAKEETGIKNVRPLTDEIITIDILPVYGHIKNNKYVSAHQHLSVAYVLIADENEELRVKEDENSGVEWFAVEKFTEDYFDNKDVYLYNKIINRARKQQNK